MKKLIKKCLDLYHKYEEIFNYLITGGLGVIVSVTFYTIPSKLGCSILVSNIISWIIAVLFMYITNKIFVFKSKKNNKKDTFKEFIMFIIGRLFTLIVETLIIYFGAKVLMIDDVICKIIAQVVIIILNYILSKFIIFKK